MVGDPRNRRHPSREQVTQDKRQRDCPPRRHRETPGGAVPLAKGSGQFKWEEVARGRAFLEKVKLMQYRACFESIKRFT